MGDLFCGRCYNTHFEHRADAPCPQVTERAFTNELGNRIRITIEGPTSVSENILTPMEARELLAALAERLSA